MPVNILRHGKDAVHSFCKLNLTPLNENHGAAAILRPTNKTRSLLTNSFPSSSHYIYALTFLCFFCFFCFFVLLDRWRRFSSQTYRYMGHMCAYTPETASNKLGNVSVFSFLLPTLCPIEIRYALPRLARLPSPRLSLKDWVNKRHRRLDKHACVTCMCLVVF